MHALKEAVYYLAPHLLIVAVVPLVIAMGHGVVRLASGSSAWPVPIGAFLSKSIYYAIFAVFGLSTAFFVSTGFSRIGYTATNPQLQAFATPLITLLTAALGYASLKTAKSFARDQIAFGLASYLLTTILSYQTFVQQFLADFS